MHMTRYGLTRKLSPKTPARGTLCGTGGEAECREGCKDGQDGTKALNLGEAEAQDTDLPFLVSGRFRCS